MRCSLRPTIGIRKDPRIAALSSSFIYSTMCQPYSASTHRCLSVKERIKLGIHGLATRVRERLHEREGGLRRPRSKASLPPLQRLKAELDETRAQLAEVEGKLATSETAGRCSISLTRRHRLLPASFLRTAAYRGPATFAMP
jgi:hypothetical protein